MLKFAHTLLEHLDGVACEVNGRAQAVLAKALRASVDRLLG